MLGAALQDIKTYVAHLQNNVAQYIATRPILDLCLAVGRRPWEQVSKRWWEQENLDLEGIREVARVVEVEKGPRERAGEETGGEGVGLLRKEIL